MINLAEKTERPTSNSQIERQNRVLYSE